MAFRITGKQFFLTYPKCDVPKEVIQIQLEDMGKLVAFAISEELHRDGTGHRHAYIKFDRKKNFTSPKCFDIEWESETFHGNYQTVKNAEATINYVTKDKCFIQKLEEEEPETDPFEIAKSMSEAEFIKWCIKNKISYAYCARILEMINQPNTINENSEGITNPSLMQEQLVRDSKDTDLTRKHPQSMTQMNPKKISTLEENLLSYSESQELERLSGRSIICPNQSCSLLTSIHSENSMKDYTDPYYSMICPSPIYQEKHKSIWSTLNNLDPFMFDMQQQIFQQV